MIYSKSKEITGKIVMPCSIGYKLGGGVNAPVTEDSRKYDYLETDYHE
ncbi:MULTISPECIES: hypothetical protein [Bacteroides]|nr:MULTISPECIES: hypothetical protein [Bacteroides]QQR18212.1 hypothetical protein I5Q79_04645 [Bacteroides caecimuris]